MVPYAILEQDQGIMSYCRDLRISRGRLPTHLHGTLVLEEQERAHDILARQFWRKTFWC
jgi:hypothetical protein